MTTNNDIADATEDAPGLTPAGNGGAEAIVCTMTAEGRTQVLRSACVVLPDGHPLKSRAQAVLEKVRGRGENGIDEAGDAEVTETAIAAWRAVEVIKEANGRKSYQMTDDFRNAAISRMQQHLSQGTVVPTELDDLRKEFESGHGYYPELCAWVYLHGSPAITGLGSLHFRELANRAARGTGSAEDESWKDWLNILVGYLLKNDPDEEYIQKRPGATFIRPAGTTYETHAGEIMHGENYGIHGVFKASAHCCSWLARLVRREQAGNAAAQADVASPAPPPTSAAKAAAKPPQACNWEDIEISFLSDERVQITIGTQTETRNYDEMGFASKKNGTPVLAWVTLRAMASQKGVTRIASDSRQWAEVEKRIQEIRKVLRRLFGITDDPLPFIKKTRRNREDFGYRAKFKIGCRPSYES